MNGQAKVDLAKKIYFTRKFGRVLPMALVCDKCLPQSLRKSTIHQTTAGETIEVHEAYFIHHSGGKTQLVSDAELSEASRSMGIQARIIVPCDRCEGDPLCCQRPEWPKN